MRNKPCRKGDRLIKSLASGVVVFDPNKFIVSFSVTQFPCGYVRVLRDHTLHIRVSHKPDEKGSSISELDGLSASDYNHRYGRRARRG